jgi:hypothetical protein
LRRLMVLLGLLAAMMLMASPVLAWESGPNEGTLYSENYYPNGYFNYCEPDGAQYYGDQKASNENVCDHRYIDRPGQPAYEVKWFNGEKFYYVHVVYFWETPDGQGHNWDDWYYCEPHKFDNPNGPKPYFNAWVTYKADPIGNHNWESFFYLQKEG